MSKSIRNEHAHLCFWQNCQNCLQVWSLHIQNLVQFIALMFVYSWLSMQVLQWTNFEWQRWIIFLYHLLTGCNLSELQGGQILFEVACVLIQFIFHEICVPVYETQINLRIFLVKKQPKKLFQPIVRRLQNIFCLWKKMVGKSNVAVKID